MEMYGIRQPHPPVLHTGDGDGEGDELEPPRQASVASLGQSQVIERATYGLAAAAMLPAIWVRNTSADQIPKHMLTRPKGTGAVRFGSERELVGWDNVGEPDHAEYDGRLRRWRCAGESVECQQRRLVGGIQRDPDRYRDYRWLVREHGAGVSARKEKRRRVYNVDSAQWHEVTARSDTDKHSAFLNVLL